MISCYTGTKPDLRYVDDVAGTASCNEEDLRQFVEFASSFHHNVEYTWSVSTDKLPFLDIYFSRVITLKEIINKDFQLELFAM